MSGYDLMLHIRGFGMEVSPGTACYQISRLEKKGIIEPAEDASEKDKRTYRITKEGLAAFKEFKDMETST